MGLSLEGKSCLVTGGSRGIGRSIALRLAEFGADVAITYARSADAANEVVKEIEALGRKGKAFQADAVDYSQAEDVIKTITDEFGKIDVLVNNAGIIKRVPILDMEVQDFKQVLDVDLVAPFIMAKHVVPGMIKRGHGKIINMCSMMSELGRDNVGAYAAAKGGLKMLTRNMATEWARHNIQVNGIGPGYFATEQTKPIRVDGHPFNEFILQRTPAGKWGESSDLQGAAIYLSAPASNFVNGHILYVDGGILATIGKPANE